jgi:thiol-disulfide isomerase/thioredoxin
MRFLCVLLLAVPVWADRCTLPADIADFIQSLPIDRGARHDAIGEALKPKPDDFSLNRLFLDGSVYERRAVREQYQHEYEAHFGDLDFAYLYARSLVGSNTPEALKIYAQILAKDPDYPWVHLSQLEIYRAEAFRDRKKLESSFVTLRRACPSLWEPYEYLGEIENTELVAREATRLREFLTTSKDPRRLSLHRALWAAEFRVRPKTESDAERQVVAEDLKRLRAFESIPELQSVLTNGARLAGDDAFAKEIAAMRKPDLSIERREWYTAHPSPKPDDPPDKRRAYAQAKLEAATKWIKEAPASWLALVYSERLSALVALEAPADELGRAGDELLAFNRSRHVGPLTWFLDVARAYMDRVVLLDRVPAILEEALKSFDDPEAIIEIDLAPSPEHTASNRMMLVSNHANAAAMVSEFYEKQGQADKAKEVLRSLEDYLVTKAPSHDEKNPMLERQYRAAQSTYWRQVATLAEHEGLKLDALYAYREATVAFGTKNEALLSAQRRLWTGLGGSDETWVWWVNAIPDPARQQNLPAHVEFAAVNRTLQEFSLKDAAGQTWTLARFKGKTTIAIVWATWCQPCRAELPYLAKLAATLKDRNDVQVISFNTDENIGAVEPFLKQSGYTFPVLFAQHFAEDLMPYFAIPRTWIIRDGVLTAESVGFGGDWQKWQDEIAAQLK